MEYAQKRVSPLLAQILAQMQDQQQFRPQSYGALAAGLGAQALNQSSLNRAMAQEQAQRQAQQRALVEALGTFQRQSTDYPETPLPPGSTPIAGGNTWPGVEGDPEMARGNLLQSLSGIDNPLAQGASQQILAQMLAPPPAPEKVDLGDMIGFVRNGELVGAIPKGVTPDVTLREAGEDRRLGVREGGEDRRLGIRETGEDRRLLMRLLQDRENQDKTNDRERLKTTQALRKEFNDLQTVKDYRTALPIIESAVNAPDTPQGDLQLVYSVGKLLDPNSVVREGELALVMEANSPIQRLIGATRLNFAGGGRLTPTTRNQIMQMLNERVGAYRQAYDQDYSQYADYARRQGVDPQEIVGNRADAAFQQRGTISVETESEREKLPSGAVYRAPDGTLRRKQ